MIKFLAGIGVGCLIMVIAFALAIIAEMEDDTEDECFEWLDDCEEECKRV